MREILFRGKQMDNGEWLFGDLRHIFHGEYRTHIVDNSNGLNNGVCGLEVASSTVGQFTGLTDKNGTKIFEGDVIDDLGVEYIVVFDSDYAQFRGKFDGWNAEISHIASRCEVIGNIYDNPYDNPELLEVSKND